MKRMTKRITISVNGAESHIKSAPELLTVMADAASMKYLEVWVEKGTESICMLANGSQAWLMYLLNQDEEFYSTRNPKVDEDTGEYLDFFLANGQGDVYPVSYLIAKEEAIRGMEYFIEHGGRAPWLSWHNDNV
jgi:hypothetical protein